MQRLAAALLVLVLAALAGCAAPVEAPPETASVAAAQVAPDASELAPLPCGTVLSPDPELMAEVTAAAARWTVATGCPVTVGEGGTRIRLVTEINDNGTLRPGLTHYEADGVTLVIDVTNERDGRTLPHEIGHLLFPHPGHVDGETALMSHAGGKGRITAADLEYVCAGYGCLTFKPED